MIPPYGERIPKFDGKRCVEKAGDLKVAEYEGLMRTATFVLADMVEGSGEVSAGLTEDLVDWWSALAEACVMNWEE